MALVTTVLFLYPRPISSQEALGPSEPAPSKPATFTAPSVVFTESIVASESIEAAAAEELADAVIVIDPGHQEKANSSLEPIGPGASERKPKVSSGTRGVVTGNPESKINLRIAKKLRDELESRGATVVMVRESEDVDISNSERAKIANSANCDLFVRIHCDGNDDRDRHGVSTLVPASNRWTEPIVRSSGMAGRAIQRAVIDATGAKDLGVVERNDLSGFNWSEMPTVLLELGFMTNPEDDRKLDSDEYQQELAEGIADGIADYMAETREIDDRTHRKSIVP